MDRRRATALLTIGAVCAIAAQGAPAGAASDPDWGDACRSAVAGQIRYPRERWSAAQAPSSGKILVKVDRRGKVVDVTVLKTSGVAELDREAVAAGWRVDPLPPPPDFMAAGYPTCLVWVQPAP